MIYRVEQERGENKRNGDLHLAFLNSFLGRREENSRLNTHLIIGSDKLKIFFSGFIMSFVDLDRSNM